MSPNAWSNLPEGISSKSLPVKDLNMHILDCGEKGAPLLILLHGFPEIAYSWRAVIVPLAQAGYRVVAPDQRGYGRTTSNAGPAVPIRYQDDLQSFRLMNMVSDIVALVFALGYTTVHTVIGHDFGSAIAGSCALIRPDIFKSVVLMSAPFIGPPQLPFDIVDKPAKQDNIPAMLPRGFLELSQLGPPKKHYMAYFAGPTANVDMLQAPQGLHAFLRGYFHIKSAKWKENDPHLLPSSQSCLTTISCRWKLQWPM